MSKPLFALLAASAAAPVIATNGEILDRIDAPSLNLNLAGIQQQLSGLDMQALMQHPEQILAILQSLLNGASPYAEEFGSFAMERATQYSDPAFFSNYSSSELSSMYEEAYPGYASARAPSYQQEESNGFNIGQLPGLSGLSGMGGQPAFSAMGGGLSGMFAPNYGYMSQEEFNDIVFD